MNKEKEILIQNFNKINFNNICFGNKKIKDDVQIIDIKYKQDQNKIPFYFKTSSIKLISNYKHNSIRGDYIEGLINDLDFYKFILKLEDYVKHLLIQKSHKVFKTLKSDETLSGEMLDELFKTNIRLDRHFTDPIIRLNITTHTKNKNTKIYDYNKNMTEFNALEADKSINCIIYFKQIFIYDNIYEFDLIVEEIRFN